MKYSTLSILIFCMLFLQSCDKETFDLDKLGQEIELREGNLMDRKECFELVYPIEIVLPDESIISVDSEEEFRTQLKEWYKLNPDSKERPSLNYPIQVTFEGDKSKVISSEEQMMRLKKYCNDRKSIKRKVCFKLVYPLTYMMPDGSSISGENELEIRSQIKEWYASNPDTDVKPSLSYPVNAKVIGGDIITIDNEEAMIALKKRCNKRDIVDCFKMDYPITFSMPDGSELSVDNEKDMNSSIKNWYLNNPDEDDKPSLHYPVDIILENGKMLTINNEEEMIKLKKRCGDK
jgi:hypothetical protein